ncbi:MAG: WhiB family transcriptional regulator, partial [Acidimicrobiia bacterium]
EAIALAVCAACPVRVECLGHALATNERFGVWGGTTEKERRSLARIG